MPMPFYDEEFTFTQPDGTKIRVRGTGDQDSAVFETLDGYTIVRDDRSGYFHHGSLSQGRVPKINACSMPQGTSGAVSETILRRLAVRDRKTGVAPRLAPIRSPFHTAWATNRHRAYRLPLPVVAVTSSISLGRHSFVKNGSSGL